MAQIGFAGTNSGKEIRKSIFIILFCAFIIWFVIWLIDSIGGMFDDLSNPQTVNISEDKGLDEAEACIEAEQYVIQILKYPSTADFSMWGCAVTNLGDNKYKASSYVDSKNSFGAKIRSNWSVTFQMLNNNRQKQLIQMIFDGKVVYSIEESKEYQQQKAVQ